MNDKNSTYAVSPLVTQLRTPYCIHDCGMSYLIRTGDGSFVMIDGGAGEYEEADHLWDVMREQHREAILAQCGGSESCGSAETPFAAAEKPVIAAWFITHPHLDHFGGFVQFMDKYGDRVSLKSLLYHWPVPEKTAPFNDLTQFDRVVAGLGAETKIITPRRGQRFVYGGVSFDILFTCEDLYPADIPNLNDASLVMRMEVCGRRTLWLGDIQNQAAAFLCENYSAEELQCEFLQVGHHGYAGGSDALHRRVDPAVLLWPCPDFWYPVVRLWPANDYLIHSEKVREIFLAGREEVTIDMTGPVPAGDPWKRVEKGEIIYEERFEGQRVIDLHWSCLTGGPTGYRPPKISLEKGMCCLETTMPDAWSICEFVKAGQMALNPDYELTFSGRLAEGSEKFGLLWDYLSPMTFDEERVLWLEPGAREFIYCLKADAASRSAQLYCDGQLLGAMPYETTGGLHFVLKNGKVILHHIRLVKK